MDAVLVAVTVVSLALALAMAALVLKLLREERRRSDARVTALLEAVAAAQPSRRSPLAAADVLPQAKTSPAPRAVSAGVPRQAAATRNEGLSADLPLRQPMVADLFSEPEPRASLSILIATAAAGLALLLGAGFTFLAPPAAQRGETAAAALPPLELLTLRHESVPGSLTVSGIVRNPRGGALLRGGVVTVQVLDGRGQLLAAGHAPLDVTAFGPLEESPFVVTVAVSAGVARYRVGFRGEDGRVVAHVDRRTADAAVAQR